ncbi:MAG: DNA adenine methylase [Muribaculaceae bacterium]|nr:DNA adenine methylase [Muribaculaceae bacterium]
MRRYGLPYQGSKSKLAERIVDLLPSANCLYDLFAGGCAVSHCALQSNKWGKVFINDITDSVKLFEDALNGNIPDGSEWISREEFERRKDTDPYVRIVWSFSNNQKNYLYSRELEPYKKAVHEMIFASTPNERRLKFKEVCRLMPAVIGNPPYVSDSRGGGRPADQVSSERSQRLLTDFSQRNLPPPPEIQKAHRPSEQRVVSKTACIATSRWSEQCERMQAEERRGGAGDNPFCAGEYQTSVGDYRDVEILPNSIIYCDIPYKGTKGYRNKGFDHEAFYEWALKQTQPIFISEYDMPDDFVAIAEWNRVSTFCATNNNLRKVEKIFIPRHQYDTTK